VHAARQLRDVLRTECDNLRALAGMGERGFSIKRLSGFDVVEFLWLNTEEMNRICAYERGAMDCVTYIGDGVGSTNKDVCRSVIWLSSS
jgi:hypothetical protein